MANPVVHFEINCRDGHKGREFYQKLFDWKFQMWDGGGDYGMVEAGAPANAIGGGVGTVAPGTGPSVIFYIQVDDIPATLKKIKSLGGDTVQPETPIPGMGSFAHFKDIDGNVLGLYKHGA